MTTTMRQLNLGKKCQDTGNEFTGLPGAQLDERAKIIDALATVEIAIKVKSASLGKVISQVGPS